MTKKLTLVLFLLIGLEPGLAIHWNPELFGFERASNLIWWTAFPCALLASIHWARFKRMRMKRPMVVCAAYVALSVLWLDRSELMRGLYMAGMLAFPIPIAFTIWRSDIEKSCVRVFLIGTGLALLVIVSSAHSIAPTASGNVVRLGQVVGEEGKLLNPNALGSHLGLAAILAFISYRRQPKRVTLIASAFFAIGVAYTLSRTSIFSLIIAFLYFDAKSRYYVPKWSFAAIGITALLLMADYLPISMPQALLERMSGYENLSTMGGRTTIFDPFWQVITGHLNNFFFGVGAGGSWKALGTVANHPGLHFGLDGIPRLHSHNTYLEVMLNWGLFGVIGLAFILNRVIGNLRRHCSAALLNQQYFIMIFVALISLGTVAFSHIWFYVASSLVLAKAMNPQLARHEPPDRQLT